MSELLVEDAKYWAFISYSSKDVACARRLHRALEQYRIPKDLRGRPGRDGPVPEKLFPVFRDRDELPLASDLGSSIQDALRASRYLIVICSPNASASRWVNEEIRFFKSLGRGDRILALILDGEPGSTDLGQPERESFPPALRFEVDEDGEMTDRPCEPIGGDLRKGGDGWKASFLKAVAGITGLGFDAFARREAKRARRRRAVAAAVGVLAMAAGLWAWDYHRLKVGYFHDITFRHGEPQGLGELATSDVDQRFRTFRLESRKRKVRGVRVQNASGAPEDFVPTGHEVPGFSRLELRYRENGEVASHRYFDRHGCEFLQLEFSDGLGSAERRVPGQNAALVASGSELAIGAGGWASGASAATDANRSEVSRFALEFDERGYLITERFLNAWGAPTRNSDGAFARGYRRGPRGEVLAVTTLDAAGRPLASILTGAATREIQHDADGRVVRERYLDAIGEPVNLKSGFAVIEVEYDEPGNDRLRRFFRADGTPALRMGMHHEIRAEYNGRGGLIMQSYWLPDGSPGRGDEGGHLTRYELDDRSRMVAYRHFDGNGQPVTLAGRGYHEQRVTLNDAGWVIAVAYFDSEGQPAIEINEGAHRIEYEHDDEAQVIAMRVLDAAGSPALNKHGFHELRRTLDPGGLERESRWFGISGEPVPGPESAAIQRIDYDDRRNVRSVRYFDGDGQPAPGRDAYHEMRLEWNAQGLRETESYHDTEGSLTFRKDWQVAELRYEYDDRGNRIRQRAHGLDGQPTVDQDGVCEIRMRHDEFGNEIGRAFFGITADDRRMANDVGAHRLVYQRDDAGRITETRYFNTADEPVALADGEAVDRCEYDSRGRLVRQTFFGPDGEPVPGGSPGVHEIRWTYGSDAGATRVAYFDAKGNPMTAIKIGYHAWERDFDSFGNVVEERLLDITGALTHANNQVPLKRIAYDTLGNPVRYEYLSTDGQPYVLYGGNHAILEIERDARGREIARRHFGAGGEPVRSGTFGCHHQTTGFDAFGRISSQRHFDEQGAPMPASTHGAHELRFGYSPAGRIVRERYFGGDGQPVRDVNGVHEYQTDYDRFGHYAEFRYFDEAGDPVLHEKLRVARRIWRHDAGGIALEVTNYGAGGEKVVAAEGYHRVLNESIAPGKILVSRYFGPDDKPMIREGMRYGYHGFRQSYNASWQVTEVSYFGVDDAPIDSNLGHARQVSTYDALGRLETTKKIKADGTVTEHIKGVYAGSTNELLRVINLLESSDG